MYLRGRYAGGAFDNGDAYIEAMGRPHAYGSLLHRNMLESYCCADPAAPSGRRKRMGLGCPAGSSGNL